MKGQAPVRPELPILYLPTNTSNSVFFRRTENAMEEQENGDMLPLHLYMFDSELASANKRNGGADWIGKRDMELKAFHNEETGVDYANKDSVNALMRIYWNSVTTGGQHQRRPLHTYRHRTDGRRPLQDDTQDGCADLGKQAVTSDVVGIRDAEAQW